MSFDFSTLPTKTDFETNNPAPTPPTPPTEQEIYDARKSRIQNRIIRFFSRTGSGDNVELKVRIGFLTSGDKTTLQADIEAKGYTCVEDNGVMTVA